MANTDRKQLFPYADIEHDAEEHAIVMKSTMRGKADIVQITLSRNGNNFL